MIICGVLCLSLIGCGNKNIEQKAEDISTYMNKEGFETTSVKDQYEEYGYFDNADVYAAKDKDYHVEIYDIDTQSHAASFVRTNQNAFENISTEAGNAVIETADSDEEDTYTYTTTANDKLYIVARNKDKVFFVNGANSSDEKEISKIKSSLGF